VITDPRHHIVVPASAAVVLTDPHVVVLITMDSGTPVPTETRVDSLLELVSFEVKPEMS
jgi:hypothetical protein